MPSRSRILVVLPLCERLSKLVLLNLDLALKLDPSGVPFNCLISYDSSTSESVLSAIQDKASKFFATVSVHSYQPLSSTDGWPQQANWAWQGAARHVEAHFTSSHLAWLWWEPDAVPLVPGWLDKLDEAYRKGRQPFAGFKVNPQASGQPYAYMNGVGIWPSAISHYLIRSGALYVRNHPFDVVAGRDVARLLAPLNSLIEHAVKSYGGGPGLSFDSSSWRHWRESHGEAVLFHGCTDGSLQGVLLDRKVDISPIVSSFPTLAMVPPSTRSRFYHSGDIGDAIYSLPAVRELGGGEFYLGPDNRTNMSTRAKMGPALASALKPLLEAQPFIFKADYREVLPADCTYDLNQMRTLLRSHRLDMQPGFNLARCYLQAFGMKLDNDQGPWLTVPEPRTVAPVVIHRSSRYHNPLFRWQDLVKAYSGCAVFVGTRAEHEAFVADYGEIPHEPTDSILDFAQVIAGAEVFAGNQSLGYAIAEGLKMRAFLECCPGGSNTIFPRAGVSYTTESLPVVSNAPRWKPLKRHGEVVVRGPVDNFTGIGRAVCQLVTELQSSLKVSLVPLAKPETRVQLPRGVKGAIVPDSGEPGLLVAPFGWIPDHLRAGDVLLTMWESTHPDPAIIRLINQRALSVIVPSQWVATVFSSAGVTCPIHVVPLGVSSKLFHPTPQPAGKSFIVGAAGRLAHGGRRKGIEDVIEAFTLAFPAKKEKNVTLSLKLFGDCQTPEEAQSDPRIKVIAKDLTDLEMSKWYSSLSCYACASRGEGWGLHVHEAMMSSRLVIAPSYSGLADLVHDGCALVVPHTLVPATEGYKGHWCQPSVEALAEHLRVVQRKAQVVRMNSLALAGRSHVEPWTPEAFAAGVLEVLRGQGVLE